MLAALLLPESMPITLLLTTMAQSGQVLASSHLLPQYYHYSMFDVKLVLYPYKSLFE